MKMGHSKTTLFEIGPSPSRPKWTELTPIPGRPTNQIPDHLSMYRSARQLPKRKTDFSLILLFGLAHNQDVFESDVIKPL